jgi:cyclase
MDLGADKVVVGRHGASELVAELALKLGSQSVVAGVDARGFEGLDLAGVAVQAEAWGAGEIFVQSVERDGGLDGYDLDLLRPVTEAVRVPVVIGGGCSGWRDMAAAFDKRALVERGYAVRPMEAA